MPRISMAANVVLSFTLFLLIGATGIAIATTLSGWINVALLVACLEGRGEFALDATFRRALLGILAATVSMGGALLAIARLLEPYFAPEYGIPAQAAALLALVAGGLLLYSPPRSCSAPQNGATCSRISGRSRFGLRPPPRQR